MYGNKSPNTNKGRFSGGITVYFKSEINNKVSIVENSQCGIIWIKICKTIYNFEDDIYLCGAYIPPYNSKVLRQSGIDMFEIIETGIEKYKLLGKTIICGDLNARTASERDYLIHDEHLDSDFTSDIESNVLYPKRVNKDNVIDICGKRLLDLCKSTNLIICNGRLGEDDGIGEFTFLNATSNTVLDYVLAGYNDFNMFSSFNIELPNELSDHSPIRFCLHCEHPSQSRDSEVSQGEPYLRWDSARAGEFYESLLLQVTELNTITETLSNNNINDSLRLFTELLWKNAFKHFGRYKRVVKKVHINKTPWFNKECYQTRKAFNKARNIYLRLKSTHSKSAYLDSKRTYRQSKRKQKARFKMNEGLRIGSLLKKNPKTFWKIIKSQNHNNSNDRINMSMDDLYNHFNGLYGISSAPEEKNHQNTENKVDDIVDEDLDINFTSSEIKKAVFAQSNSKSPGNDKLISEIFKHIYDIISPFLLELFNTIFQKGNFPEKWAEGILIPLFKGGSHEAKNFRGITLNNILAKIYSKLLVERLTKWSIKHDTIIDNQFGFQKNKSTTDCIFILHALISKTLTNNNKLYVAYLDWEKMFDKIDRVLLWQKLLNANISSKFVCAIKAMYKSVKSTIVYKNEKSNPIISNIGVKQGDPASSILCLLYLNDIINNINSNLDGIMTVHDINIFILLFADDAALFSQNPCSLQSMLNDIENYCKMYKLNLNTTKTKIMIFEKGRPTNYDFFINDTKIEIVKSFKYLGVYFYKNGNWNQTQKRIAQHASFKLHNLFTIYNQINLPFSQKIHLFDSIIGSTLNYSAETWGTHKAPDIEAIHTKFCRKILGVKKSTNLEALYGELNRIPMYIHRKILMIKYWITILKSSENCLLTKTYKMLKTDVDNNISSNGSNWASNIKRILDESGLSYIWNSQYTTQINLQPIKQRILDMYHQQWYTQINNSPRLDTYCLFKHSFNLETYLDTIKEPKYRLALTRLRTSSHSLSIETGRQLNTPRKNRICKNCHHNQIENEYHFILICPKYSNLRKKYIKSYFYTWPTLQKFINLFSNTSIKSINNLGKYIYHAGLLRTTV